MIFLWILSILVIGIIIYIRFKREDGEKMPPIEINDVLLSPEQLEHHGIHIAGNHSLSPKEKAATCLKGRLNHNYEEIFSVYKKLHEDINEGITLSPASEWLLDNFYIIENQVKGIYQNLTREWCVKLSVLNSGSLKGVPRIYVLALELVSHTDGRIDEQLFLRFLKSYQSRKVLSIAELWALPLMITMALIENINHICKNIESSQQQLRTIKSWEELGEEELLETIKKHLETMEEIHPTFAEYLVRILRKNDLNTEKINKFLQGKFEEWDVELENMVERHYQEQASRKISIGNSITSLHGVANLDWNEIFEELSVVEKILREDPAKVYEQMDFESRNYYRDRIESIAKDCKVSENFVAKKAIECAREATQEEKDMKRQHIGFYILDDGIKQLYKMLEKEYQGRMRKPLSFYTLPIVLLTVLLGVFLAIYTYSQYAINRESSINGVSISFFVGLLAMIPISDMVISIHNWLITRNIKPRFIPKLEFLEGVGEEHTTLIVIPTLLTDIKRVKGIMEQLEVHYLSNKEENFYFAIAGDFIDAEKQKISEDREIINAAIKAVKELNKKYKNQRFFFFHRQRTYCEQQQRWMGWERKRGALVELNELLRGSEDTSYSFIEGDLKQIPSVQYVITLDADTKLPIEEGKKLVGAMAHPLHHPVLDEQERMVINGYGLIQPRISLDIESANKTTFSRIFAGQGGIDPYTTAVSDIYQDLFGEGIFTGKGIYHVDTFQKCLGNALPTNAILSHDLLEGSYIRAGLATDIQFIDGYPVRYSAYMARLHRWVRGDWQLLPWLSHRVRNSKGEKVRNPINPLSKWKIADNLRRSLVSATTLLLFIFAVAFFPGNILFLVGLALLTLFFPMIIGFMDYLILKYYKAPRERLNGNMVFGLKASLYQGLLRYVFLPYHAFVMLDAIIRTVYRLNVSKANMLEWTTAADTEKKLAKDANSYIKRMKSVFIIVGIFILLTLWAAPQNVVFAILLSIPWIASPWIAYRVSQEQKEAREDLRKEDKETLNRLSRKIWAFYEDFAGEDDHFLPPDNFQENPPNGVAHRTSPTNIGFLLMAILTARDFGFISTLEMFKKIDQTLFTIKNMETWKGHLYNWYDTKTLEVLRPHYVSTVDSGNYIAYLMTLKIGMQEYLEKNLIDISQVKGLRQTLLLSKTRDFRVIKEMNEKIEKGTLTIDDWKDFLEFTEEIECADTYWQEKFCSSIEEHKKDLQKFFPKVILEQSQLLKELNKKFKEPLERIQNHNSLQDLKKIYEEIMGILETLESQGTKNQDMNIEEIKSDIQSCQERIEETIEEVYGNVQDIEKIIEDTDFTQLYSPKRQFFSIGYNAEEEKLTDSYYDLLASEARVISYLAVVQGKVPKKHWFKLGRALTQIDGFRSLVSWTGTMFEYFMPPLIMKHYDNTLLEETYRTAIAAQIKYGKERKVPWGTSESGYYRFDLSFNYQYKAFGVPNLGLKRGLKADMVISPYSSLLGLPFAPEEAMNNIYELIGGGLEGRYGLYEAVDYTLKRLPQGQTKMIIESFMAHHQGMSMIVLNNMLHDQIMEKRFHADPIVKTGEVLLQEKVPLRVIMTKEYKDSIEPMDRAEKQIKEVEVKRVMGLSEGEMPHCHILSNGSYKVMITNEGTGFSATGDMQVTRWREDALSRNYGSFIFLRNVKNNEIWSTTHQPIGKEPDGYRVVFSEDKAEFIRNDENVETHTEIVISPEDPVEIRRVVITNHGSEEIELELTSYTELVMAPQSADLAHPTFSNLFVRTEQMKDMDGILASRRPREEHKKSIWSFHTVAVDDPNKGNMKYETARYKFIGRGKELASAEGLYKPLDNSLGAVLDPIISLQSRIKIAPESSIGVSFVSGIAQDKEQAQLLGAKYYDLLAIHQTFELSKIRNQIQLRDLNMRDRDIVLYQDMMAHILFVSPLRRKYQELLRENREGQSKLWAYGVSGDIPIVLISIKGAQEIEMIEQGIKAHQYWRIKGLKVDLVLLNEDESSYYQPMEELVREKVSNLQSGHLLDQPGGVFIRNASVIPRSDQILLYSVARLVLKGEEGSINSQLQAQEQETSLPPMKNFEKPMIEYTSLQKTEEELFFYNGYGGFLRDGSEYVIELKKGMQTPAPWINVISNPDFGFQVSENGSGFVWAENSRENKITPWSNDPTSDPPGEVIYIRDEVDGSLWTPTALPIREEQEYVIRHGRGYSEFHHDSHGINQKLTAYVPLEDSIKVNMLTLHNHSNLIRQLTLTYYIKPVMGVSDEGTKPFIITDRDEETGSLLIQNTYQSEFPNRIVAMGASEMVQSCTGDYQEFIGRQGDLNHPEALKREELSNHTGAGFIPCGAIQIKITLQPNEEKNIRFLLGYGKDIQEVQKLIKHYRNIHNAKDALKEIKNYWKHLLGKIQVKTPDVSMDYLLNGWLLYQSISCRLWARSAFYQSGGAYGYRDQLQDTMNILPVFPQATREQILINSAHQFKEGDVQHWWHPGPGDKGIRTRFSDDLLWLPLAVAEYIEQTQDYSILDEVVPFLEDEPLEEGQDERYGIPRISEEEGSIYEHCVRTIDYSLKFGENGIPLMGSGDWNDGMSTVGNKGRGESVWVGWFLYLILNRFTRLCHHKKDEERAAHYQETAIAMLRNMEENAWDGDWYRRAYFDDGTPLGSRENQECMIDSLAQSWSVISGGGNKDRSQQAMKSVEQHLVKKEEGLILLFTPPFDEGDLHPGYIKGYVPGVRENGGQYTHAATWVINALAMMGEGDKAWEYFNLINPINHSRTPIECATYKVEPYVMAADVYAASPHVGRGGWTWYTGAAGWMYTVGLKYILGLQAQGEKLFINPCIPKEWKEYEIQYRYHNTLYEIKIKNPKAVNRGVKEIKIDGNNIEEKHIPLKDDKEKYNVEVILG